MHSAYIILEHGWQQLVYHFYAPQHYAIARICHANSVCLSVTRVYCIKTTESIIEILSPSDRAIILVFHHQVTLCKSEGVTPTGAPNTRG